MSSTEPHVPGLQVGGRIVPVPTTVSKEAPAIIAMGRLLFLGAAPEDREPAREVRGFIAAHCPPGGSR